jgi:hypothetical protein
MNLKKAKKNSLIKKKKRFFDFYQKKFSSLYFKTHFFANSKNVHEPHETNFRGTNNKMMKIRRKNKIHQNT